MTTLEVDTQFPNPFLQNFWSTYNLNGDDFISSDEAPSEAWFDLVDTDKD